MTSPLTIKQLFEQEFPALRCKMLEIAAILDRLDRGQGDDVDGDYRMAWIRAGLETLESDEPHRARKLQLIFSQPYEEGWLERFTPTK
jgi:hypothetical protein